MRLQLLIQWRRWLLGLAAVIGFGVLYFWLSQPTSEEHAVSPPAAALKSGQPVRLLVVDVVGAVRSPGVVELPAGSRVRDAVEAAGGLKPGEIAGVNLARLLVDGEQVVVGQQASSATGGKVNLNTASAADLEDLPGVGPVLAERIVGYREAHGPFRSVAALDAVSGVGPALMSQLRDLVSIG